MTDNDIEQAGAPNGHPMRRAGDASGWHVGREIPIALILALLIQTGGGIWWASAMSSKLDSALQTLAEFRAERYTRDDARRDADLLTSRLDALRQRDADHDRRIESLELAIAGRQLTPRLLAR